MSEKNATPLDLDALRPRLDGHWKIVDRAPDEDGGVYPAHVVTVDGEYIVCYLEARSVAELKHKDPDALGGGTSGFAALIAAAPQLLSELLAYRARDAAVAELVAAAELVLSFRIGELPRRGDLRDNDDSRRAIHQLGESLAAVRQGVARED